MVPEKDGNMRLIKEQSAVRFVRLLVPSPVESDTASESDDARGHYILYVSAL